MVYGGILNQDGTVNYREKYTLYWVRTTQIGRVINK